MQTRDRQGADFKNEQEKSMSKRKAVIISLILAAVVLCILFELRKNLGSNRIQNKNAETDKSFDGYVDMEKIDIVTLDGNVAVNNVYKQKIDDLSAGGISFRDNSEYYIAYYPQDQGFLIVLHGSDIQVARQKAESEFLQALGVEQDQACKLRVSLTVPESVNPNVAGGNYGLSFCPNGKLFPVQ